MTEAQEKGEFTNLQHCKQYVLKCPILSLILMVLIHTLDTMNNMRKCQFSQNPVTEGLKLQEQCDSVTNINYLLNGNMCQWISESYDCSVKIS